MFSYLTAASSPDTFNHHKDIPHDDITIGHCLGGRAALGYVRGLGE